MKGIYGANTHSRVARGLRAALGPAKITNPSGGKKRGLVAKQKRKVIAPRSAAENSRVRTSNRAANQVIAQRQAQAAARRAAFIAADEAKYK